MDNARKKIWICLLCAVAVAIVVGLCYYVTDVRETGIIVGRNACKNGKIGDGRHMAATNKNYI